MYLLVEVIAQCFDVSGGSDPEGNLTLTFWYFCVICVLGIWVTILSQHSNLGHDATQ